LRAADRAGGQGGKSGRCTSRVHIKLVGVVVTVRWEAVGAVGAAVAATVRGIGWEPGRLALLLLLLLLRVVEVVEVVGTLLTSVDRGEGGCRGGGGAGGGGEGPTRPPAARLAYATRRAAKCRCRRARRLGEEEALLLLLPA